MCSTASRKMLTTKPSTLAHCRKQLKTRYQLQSSEHWHSNSTRRGGRVRCGTGDWRGRTMATHCRRRHRRHHWSMSLLLAPMMAPLWKASSISEKASCEHTQARARMVKNGASNLSLHLEGQLLCHCQCSNNLRHLHVIGRTQASNCIPAHFCRESIGITARV